MGNTNLALLCVLDLCEQLYINKLQKENHLLTSQADLIKT